MAKLKGDTINFRESGICWVKRCGSSDMQYSSQFGEYQVYSAFCRRCARPAGWCAAPSLYGDALDCDGDGLPDPACSSADKKSGGYLGSAASCADTWPGKPCKKAGMFGGLKDKLEHMGGIGSMLKKAEAEEHKIQSKLAPATKAIDEVYKGMNQPNYNAPPTLGGNDEDYINAMIYGIVGVVVVSTGLAACVDAVSPLACLEGRPRLWAITLILSSYLLLIPGLMNVLMSFSIIVNVIGHRVRVHPNASHPSCTESTPGLIELLWGTGGKTGASLLVIFAMVIPALELLLLVVGELCRFRSSAGCGRAFRLGILWVQHRSKWASPDTFAYTLLVYLIRHLDHDPLILTRARLDVGFACFCAFCVCATVAALGFPLPEVQGDDAPPEDARPPLALRCIGKTGVALTSTLLAAVFAALMYDGLQRPIMAFRINERPLFQPVGPLPIAAKKAVDVLDVPNMLKADVSLLECIGAQAQWAAGGEATSALACVMWSVFVIALTATDVLMLVLSSWRLCLYGVDKGPALLSCKDPSLLVARPCPFMAVSRALKKLAMLDVAIVGCFLVTYCMAIYKNIGVMVSAQRGLVVLSGAEVAHNAVYWLVSGVADYPAQAASYLTADVEDTANEADPTRGCQLGNGLNCFFSGKLFRRTASLGLQRQPGEKRGLV